MRLQVFDLTRGIHARTGSIAGVRFVGCGSFCGCMRPSTTALSRLTACVKRIASGNGYPGRPGATALDRAIPQGAGDGHDLRGEGQKVCESTGEISKKQHDVCLSKKWPMRAGSNDKRAIEALIEKGERTAPKHRKRDAPKGIELQHPGLSAGIGTGPKRLASGAQCMGHLAAQREGAEPGRKAGDHPKKNRRREHQIWQRSKDRGENRDEPPEGQCGHRDRCKGQCRHNGDGV